MYKFSLSIAEQRAVGFIPAWSLAFLHWCQARGMTLVIFKQVQGCSGVLLGSLG